MTKTTQDKLNMAREAYLTALKDAEHEAVGDEADAAERYEVAESKDKPFRNELRWNHEATKRAMIAIQNELSRIQAIIAGGAR